jgi:hypothetical protein
MKNSPLGSSSNQYIGSCAVTPHPDHRGATPSERTLAQKYIQFDNLSSELSILLTSHGKIIRQNRQFEHIQWPLLTPFISLIVNTIKITFLYGVLCELHVVTHTQTHTKSY